MSSANGISDLLALATIRRILLELGHALQPEAPGTLVGPLKLWMHEPRPQLDGQSPLQAIAGVDGETTAGFRILGIPERAKKKVE